MIFLLCDLLPQATFAKLPTNLKRFIKDGNIPTVPTSSIKNVDNIKKEDYRVLVRRLSQPLKVIVVKI